MDAVPHETDDDFAGHVRVRRVRFQSQDDRFAILDANVDGEPVTLRLRDILLGVARVLASDRVPRAGSALSSDHDRRRARSSKPGVVAPAGRVVGPPEMCRWARSGRRFRCR